MAWTRSAREVGVAGVVGFDVVSELIHMELTEPVNITLDVRDEDLVDSIAHLEECGFKFDLRQ